MIIDQGSNVFDIHCDKCGDCQTVTGMFSKAQLAVAVKQDGWEYKWTEEKWLHFCKKCKEEIQEIEERKKQAIRHKLIDDLMDLSDPVYGVLKYSSDREYWSGIIKQALEIIQNDKS